MIEACSHGIRPPRACDDCDQEALRCLHAAAPSLLEASQKVLAWWDEKLANELASNRDFPWAEDAEWTEFHVLRIALAKALPQMISKNNGMLQLGFRHSSYTRLPPKDLVEGLAKALVLDRGYGGPERSIHYYPIGEPISEGDLWTVAIADNWTEDYKLQPKADPTGKIALVEGKYNCKTGKRVGGYATEDWESGHREWENGYLEDEKTHVILKTTWGDIETCDVEPA